MRASIVCAIGVAGAAVIEKRQEDSSTVPQYFQTYPELYTGPTLTGEPAALAETNPAPFPGTTYIPPQPLETQAPIIGTPSDGGNIFQLFGQLSHYFPNPDGFGVDEYTLPKGTNITKLHMLHRHGSRCPTAKYGTVDKLLNNTDKWQASGKLSFLNEWTYKLGEQILVPVGKQELFDSGVLHQYLYGNLYPNNGSKIIARSTTQDRMIQSAEYFLAGFFGLRWPDNATLEVIIEEPNFNNSLAGYFACNNSNLPVSTGGTNATKKWASVYLADALERLQGMIDPPDAINITDVYNFQSLCAYETVALGYSSFCDLFTFEEWQGYEYSVDINFAGNNAFQSPTGRAVGIGWVEELRARLTHEYLTTARGSVNVTLDSMPSTFPLDQALNFDFSHDTNIMSILTAFGLTQFQPFMPDTTYTPHRSLIVSHMEPFAARLDIEIIEAPRPVVVNRGALGPDSSPYADAGEPTTYVHFKLNQRTIPLGVSYSECGLRRDGWCEIGAFLDATAGAWEASRYDYACNGDYESLPYGSINSGAPQ
ncbi:phosphoglycerate mutase-like protein [Aulographum hederae CBS 113979]|uniref:3-phytase n=1 Tax=Aulographum hederae CBS 113979 TaxID=1176131 RepID=A0A6G1GKP2_9PEZI|nr:phosphoglycerate mutase-like protein [Aulographum hederae CBS 113979]